MSYRKRQLQVNPNFSLRRAGETRFVRCEQGERENLVALMFALAVGFSPLETDVNPCVHSVLCESDNFRLTGVNQTLRCVLGGCQSVG